MNPGESYDPLLMSLVKSTSIIVDEGEETGFLSPETTETCIVYMYCMCTIQSINGQVPLNEVW